MQKLYREIIFIGVALLLLLLLAREAVAVRQDIADGCRAYPGTLYSEEFGACVAIVASPEVTP